MLLFWLTFALQLEYCSGTCPYQTARYYDRTTNKSFCYVLLHFEEIAFIRQVLWRDTTKKTKYYNGDGRQRVESYPDALRMCAAIPYIDESRHRESKYLTFFKPEWREIPGEDVPIRLPTPETQEHLKWLEETLIYDYYYKNGYDCDSRGRKHGRMWLGIKNSTSNFTGVQGTARAAQLKDTKLEGQCGYLFLGRDASSSNPSGLYWLRCKDEELPPQRDYYWYCDNYVVACEFDEPRDCVQERIANTCALSGTDVCVELDSYKTWVQPHTRFGWPCKVNASISTLNTTCPKEFEDQCKRKCLWGTWTPISPCYIEMKENRYVCDEDDPYGMMDYWRELRRKPIYGGECDRRQFRRRYCECSAHTTTVAKLMLISSIIAYLAL